MKMSKVFTNASWIVGCKVAQSVFALLINALTARFFGPSNFGLINYAASLVAFVTPLMTLGMNDVLVGEIIRNPEHEGKVLGTSITMTFVSSLACIIGLYTFVSVAHPNDTTTQITVLLYSLLLMVQSIEQIQYWFHSKFLSKFVSITSFFSCAAVSLYKLILLLCKKDISWFAVSHSLEYLLTALCLHVIYKNRNGPKLKFSIAVAKKLWNQGKYYIIPGMMGLVLAQSDRVMIRFFHGDVEVGFYSAAISVAGLTSFVFSAIITSFRPVIVETKQKSKAQYESNLIKLYGVVTYLAVLQSILLAVFARGVVSLLYGQDYMPAVSILRVVVWYTVFSYIGGANMVWVLTENKQKYMLCVKVAGAFINIGLNLILIPRYHGIGAAIATAITQVFTNIIMVYLIKPLRVNVRYLLMGLNINNLIG